MVRKIPLYIYIIIYTHSILGDKQKQIKLAESCFKKTHEMTAQNVIKSTVKCEKIHVLPNILKLEQ